MIFTDAMGAESVIGTFDSSTFILAATIPPDSALGSGTVSSHVSKYNHATHQCDLGWGGQAPFSVTGSGIECVISPPPARNLVLGCPNDPRPRREAMIAVDPLDPRHVVQAAIIGIVPQWQEFPTPPSTQSIQFSATFDGGKTWSIGSIPHDPAIHDWDPWLAFDVKHGEVILAFESTGSNANLCPPPQDQWVVASHDGGLHWGAPVMVLAGHGCGGDPRGELLEEGKVATDNNPSSPYFGRSWLTGELLEWRHVTQYAQPIAEMHSDDGGATWSKPRVISGSNAEYCTADPFPPKCDNDYPPALPVISADGSVHVAFLNQQDEAAWEQGECCEDQLLVVSSSDGGHTWTAPVHIADLETGGSFTGYGDYDCSTDVFFSCRLTGTDLSPEPAGGYMAAGPGSSLYVVFSDNRDGLHDVPHPVSNNDVFVMSSMDGGLTWTGPDVVSDAPGDQFKPNIAVDPRTGSLGILFYDRNGGPDAKTMDVTVATGAPHDFKLTTVTTARSHLSDDLWFTQTLDDCRHCVFHTGEYLGIAYGSDGTANMTWTDLRRFQTLPGGRAGFTMSADYSRATTNHGAHA